MSMNLDDLIKQLEAERRSFEGYLCDYDGDIGEMLSDICDEISEVLEYAYELKEEMK